ncbi:DUF4362 domain-containing protein [Paenibacillus sp. CF384]|uniref:DUF4362 domain-containing protein n=1 Tax=Paenibacillus sp. CF384 TaxID=1884382 RepID=UPI0008964B60|nr:DUF4362 domain-containing protein [Paenibacillus sp. CF384]SDW20988.1 protein of unknown function [Paenibacillus sp. CF384]
MMRKALIIGMALLLLLTACGRVGSSGQTEGGQTHGAGDDFPKVTEPYNPDQAIQNGDVVNLHGKYSNLEKWNQFVKHVKEKQAGRMNVRITQYSIEGDPIFYELTYDGKQIYYTFDNSMDAFGSDLGRPSTTCEGFDTKQNDQGQSYVVLSGCVDQKTADTFYFAADAK